jgi:hypothetical protein
MEEDPDTFRPMPEVAEVSLVVASPAFGILLSAALVVSVVLYLLGVTGRNPKLTGAGILLGGLTVLATDIALFLGGQPPAGGEYRLTASDILLIAVLGFLGGALSMLGASYLTIARRIGRPARA